MSKVGLILGIIFLTDTMAVILLLSLADITLKDLPSVILQISLRLIGSMLLIYYSIGTRDSQRIGR